MAIEVEGGSGGGVFVPKTTEINKRIPSGATGTLLTLTPVSGERVRLCTLTIMATATFPNITISSSVSGNVVTGNLTNAAEDSYSGLTGHFFIGSSTGGGLTPVLRVTPPIIFEKDAVVTISSTDNLSAEVAYSYELGSIK